MSDAFAKNQEEAHEIAKNKEAAEKTEAQECIDQASHRGDSSLLYHSLSLHRKILDEIDNEKFIDTPLHTAARLGHSKFCAEMMNLMPSFGRKLNPEGFSPLHLALKHGHQKVVRNLVDMDKELVRVKGRDGITPLIYCSQSEDYNGTLATFLWDCPQAIFDKSTSSETALHFALKSGNCKGAEMILNWLCRSSVEKLILDSKDDEGNTPLHLAIKHRCTEAVKMLVMRSSRLNHINDNSETPLDIANQLGNDGTIKLLKKRKAKTSSQLERSFSYADFLQSPMSCLEKVVKCYNFMMKDLDVDMRNVILVVAALIAAATYTAVLQPPGGLYQASANTTNDLASSVKPLKSNVFSISKSNASSNAGKMVMDNGRYRTFMPLNTLAFTLAIAVIIFVLPGNLYTFALHMSLLALSYCCLMAMHFVYQYSGTATISFSLAWAVIGLAFSVKIWYFLLKGFIWEEWWMPNFILQGRNNEMMSCPCYKARDRIPIMSAIRMQQRLTVGTLNDKMP